VVGNKHQFPPYTRDMMLAEIEQFGRGPFRNALADLLEAKPSVEKLSAFAERFPDRWAQATTIIAKLAGYTEKTEIIGNINILIHQMSDSALLQELQKSEKEPIDVTPVDSSQES